MRILFLLLLTGLLVGCNSNSDSNSDKQDVVRPAILIEVGNDSVDSFRSFPSTIQGQKGSELAFAVNGVVQEVLVRAAQEVEQGQVLAKLVAKELNAGNNVVITHGTDTLHFTAAALSFMLKNLYKPVVLVGAQRSVDRGSSDAFSNLLCATYMALSNVGEVGICMHGSMNDDYCTFNRGTRVRKMHTSRRDAFRTMKDEPIAKVSTKGNIDTISKYNHRKNEKVKVDDKFEPKVALLKAYPNSDPEILEILVKKGYKGFVIEGMALGHLPTAGKKSWIPIVKKLTKKGIPIVVTPQTLYGRIKPNVYANLIKVYHEAGAIPGEDMLPEVAYVKLSWVLGHTKKLDEVKKMMLTNIAGEITERSVVNTLQV